MKDTKCRASTSSPRSQIPIQIEQAQAKSNRNMSLSGCECKFLLEFGLGIILEDLLWDRKPFTILINDLTFLKDPPNWINGNFRKF